MRHREIKQQFIDPVCGMSVDPNTAAAKICYNGVEIYFCAEGCKKTFESNPGKFKVKNHKGFWQRYLDRLNKATGGQAQSCH
ncbi:MAG: YHS domain-containing protein [Candidatus Promineifilaceae bacterium]